MERVLTFRTTHRRDACVDTRAFRDGVGVESNEGILALKILGRSVMGTGRSFCSWGFEAKSSPELLCRGRSNV